MKVVGYVRVSTEEQARDKKSLATQERKIEEFCKLKDYELERIFKDEGYSGKDLKRLAIESLLDRLKDKRNKIDVLVVYKIDRLSRRQRDLWHLLDDIFMKNNIDFVSVTENFDTTTAVGRALFGMLGVFAQLQRDEIAQRTQEALRYKKKNGQRVGTIPYGYDLGNNGADLIRNEEEQQVISQMKELRQQGLSYDSIAEELNSKGIQAKNGGSWHARTIWGILQPA